ncbi:MAG: CSLREA domain-containing protein, partial [Actinomycetota bacterium]|nr:CSLREA domain-containing protein [Actinomycetota bacterium]
MMSTNFSVKTRAPGRAKKVLATGLLAMVVALLFGLLVTARPAHAVTITVNSVADTVADNGECTLREAIGAANNNTSSGATPGECAAGLGTDTINFNIGGAAGVKTIAPSSALPPIIEAVTINGYSQPGASANNLAQGNDAVLLIELKGTGAGAGAAGLNIQASNSGVEGLVVNNFNRGVQISTGSS